MSSSLDGNQLSEAEEKVRLWLIATLEDVRRLSPEFTWDETALPLSYTLTPEPEPRLATFCFRGKFAEKDAVIKIRGVKGEVEEGDMLRLFGMLRNEDPDSPTIRPPFLYDHLRWDDEKQYEAIIMEDIGYDRFIKTIPPSVVEMYRYFNLYSSYKKLSEHHEWIRKPEKDAAAHIWEALLKTKETGALYHHNPARHAGDAAIIERAIGILGREYNGVSLTFQHSPYTPEDLFDIPGSDDLALLSNASWSWKVPFYDLAEGYYLHLLTLSWIPGMVPTVLEEQATMWTEWMKYGDMKQEGVSLPEAEPQQKHLWRLAMLERSTTWLACDALRILKNNPLRGFMVDLSRKNVISLLKQFPNGEDSQSNLTNTL